MSFRSTGRRNKEMVVVASNTKTGRPEETRKNASHPLGERKIVVILWSGSWRQL